jgi:hypothetical protein
MRPKNVLFMVLVLLIMMALPTVALAQEGEPAGPDVVEQGIGLLEYLIVVAAVVAILIEQIKPVVFDPLRERLSDQAYLLALYATRTLLGVIAVVVYGGAEQMTEYLPWLASLPDAVVIGTGALLVAIGTEILHPLLDMLYALRDRVDPSVEFEAESARGSREVIVG